MLKKAIKEKMKEFDKRIARLSIEFDPDKIPPNFDAAKNHLKATLCGPEVEKSKNPIFCVCCSRRIDRTLLDLNDDLKEFGFLGAGIPLYFTYISYCIIFLIIILFSSGIFNIVTSYYYGHDCIANEEYEQKEADEQQDQCMRSFATQFSLGNKKSERELIRIQEILNFVTIVLVIICLQFFRKKQRQTAIICDNTDICASDYTVFISNIPISDNIKDYDEELKKFLQENIKLKNCNHEVEISDVNLVYKLVDYYAIIEEKNLLIKKKQDALLFKQNHPQKLFPEGYLLTENDEQIKDQDKESEEIEHKFVDGKGSEFMKKYFTGKAFISFSHEIVKDHFLLYYKNKKQILNYNGNILQVREAAKPTDVFWENQSYGEEILKSRKRKSNILMVLCLLGVFIFIVGCRYFNFFAEKMIYTQNKDENGQVIEVSTSAQILLAVIQQVIGILISGLNYVLILICTKLTNFERQQTKTDYKISLAIKLALAQFFNSSLCNFVIQVWLLGGNRSNFAIIFGNSGLVSSQHSIFISNTVVTFIVDVIDPPYWIKKIQIHKLERAGFVNCILTQQQLNQTYEMPEFMIEIRYAQILNMMFTIAFYTPVLPFAILYCITNLFFTYWLDKQKIIRKRTIKTAIDDDLSIEMTEMLELILPIFSASNLFFFYFFQGEAQIITVIGLAIGIIHAVMPMHDINEKLFKLKDPEPNEKTYINAKYDFDTDYARTNPATGQQARQKYIKNELNDQILLKTKTLQTFNSKSQLMMTMDLLIEKIVNEIEQKQIEIIQTQEIQTSKLQDRNKIPLNPTQDSIPNIEEKKDQTEKKQKKEQKDKKYKKLKNQIQYNFEQFSQSSDSSHDNLSSINKKRQSNLIDSKQNFIGTFQSGLSEREKRNDEHIICKSNLKSQTNVQMINLGDSQFQNSRDSQFQNLGNKKLKERYDNIPSFLIDNKIIVIDDYDEKNQSFN